MFSLLLLSLSTNTHTHTHTNTFQFSTTPIGIHDRFNVVRVHHHSPKCLVEEVARGETISKALKGCGKDWREKHPEVQNIMQLLTEYHRAVFDAFIKDGLIHSDIHLGNAIVQFDDDEVRFALFDVGQFERIGPADTRAILWSLSWLSTLCSLSLSLSLLIKPLEYEQVHPHVTLSFAP